MGKLFYTHHDPKNFGKDIVSKCAQNEKHCVREHKFIYRISTHSLFSACISHFNDNKKSYTSVGVYWWSNTVIDSAKFRKQGVQHHYPAVYTQRQ